MIQWCEQETYAVKYEKFLPLKLRHLCSSYVFWEKAGIEGLVLSCEEADARLVYGNQWHNSSLSSFNKNFPTLCIIECQNHKASFFFFFSLFDRHYLIYSRKKS